VAEDAAGPGDRSAAAGIDRLVLRQDADAARALDEDTVAIEQPRHVAVVLREVLDETAHHIDPVVVDITLQPAETQVAGMETLSRGRLRNVVNLLALDEEVEEGGQGAEVQRRSAA